MNYFIMVYIFLTFPVHSIFALSQSQYVVASASSAISEPTKLALSYLAEARAAVEKATDADYMVCTLNDIADAQRKAGDFVTARATVDSASRHVRNITNGYDQECAFRNVAAAYASLGDTTCAYRMAYSLTDEVKVDFALESIASKQVEIEDVSAALVTVDKMRASSSDLHVMADIAVLQAKKGEMAKSDDWIDVLIDPLGYYEQAASILCRIAENEIDMGNRTKALEIMKRVEEYADSFEEGSESFFVNLHICKIQRSLGHDDAAKKALEKAEGTANNYSYMPQKSSSLAMIASAKYGLGETEKAGEIAENLSAPVYSDQARAEIVCGQAQQGHLAEAKITAASVTIPVWRNMAYTDIAWTESKSELFKEALATARMIPDNSSRGHSIEHVLKEMVLKGRYQEACEFMRQCKDPIEMASMQIGTAQGLLESVLEKNPHKANIK